VRYSNHTDSSITIPVLEHKIKPKDEDAEEKYEPLTFEQCLESFAADSTIENEYNCPACNKKTSAVT